LELQVACAKLDDDKSVCGSCVFYELVVKCLLEHLLELLQLLLELLLELELLGSAINQLFFMGGAPSTQLRFKKGNLEDLEDLM
jgi:hypothetical protein